MTSKVSIMIYTFTLQPEFHRRFTEKHNFETAHDAGSTTFTRAPGLPTSSMYQSTDPTDVADVPRDALSLSNYISQCIAAQSRLNLTAENAITISYHLHPVISQRGRNKRTTTSDATVTPSSIPGEVCCPSSQSPPVPSAKVSREPSSLEPVAGSCSIFIEAPPGKVLSILVLNQTCSRDNRVHVEDLHDGWATALDGCGVWVSPGYDVTTANRSALVTIQVLDLLGVYRLEVHVKSQVAQISDGFLTRYVSPVLGYIQTPDWHPFARPFSGLSKGTVAVTVPLNHVTMLSVAYFRWDCQAGESRAHNMNVHTATTKADGRTRWKGLYHARCRLPVLYKFNILHSLSKLTVEFVYMPTDFFNGVRLLFSFHQPSSAPKLERGFILNCTVPFWPDFRLHLVCNLRVDCLRREDEMWCPHACDDGGVLFNDRCYSLRQWSIPLRQSYSWQLAKRECSCDRMSSSASKAQREGPGKKTGSRGLIDRSNPRFRNAARKRYPFPSVSCPSQHRTREFLACDVLSACYYGVESSDDVSMTTDNAVISTCVDRDAISFKTLFQCQLGTRSVPYSLVCNHLRDCGDNSDEGFCVFPSCSHDQYQCTNGQCLRFALHCDEIVQCVDESDETDCWAASFPKGVFDYGCESSECLDSGVSIELTRPPAIANFDGSGRIVYTPLNLPNKMSATACPETHVFCHVDGFCVPVYVRCNGVYDCPGLEDEASCDSYTCPGLYRCRGLQTICLHPDHLCDGWSQCPKHDDEVFCNLTCPVDCTCLGHAFSCTGDFQVELFSGLRYLDLSGTGLKPARLFKNTMLVCLDLAHCDLTHLDNLTLPNLLSLDLSDNRFSVVTVAELNGMKNLQNLSLARNPLSTLFSGNDSSSLSENEHILHVDLTGVELKVLDVPRHLPFPSLLSLNLSDSGVTRVIGDGFRSLTSLRVLDVRGCPMTAFPDHVLKKLKALRLVFADNFKVCCEANLPDGFNVGDCQAPFNEVSSCEALLRADVYRVCLYVLAALSVSGNLGCFLLRILSLTQRGKTGFSVFVTHLCVSDFMMGVYLVTIGAADRLFRGRYLWEEETWRHSAACQLAGVLALLSSEVSAFIICLITLDRFLVIRFPFSRLRFSAFTAQVASVLTWVVGAALVTAPLLPVTPYKHFYSQTGICVPLPITHSDFSGQEYAFGVLILLNLVVFIMIAAGQVLVYLSMTSNAMSSIDVTRKSRDIIVARRLITVVVSDFLCWFPVGMLGVLARRGVRISSEINVAIAIYVLPLNAALNPFLYTLNMLQEKRKRTTERRLLMLIMDREIGDDE